MDKGPRTTPQRPLGATIRDPTSPRRGTDLTALPTLTAVDAETLQVLQNAIGEEAGIPPGHRHRLRGATVGELRQDAAGMRSELGLEPLADPLPRDRGGKFAKSGGIYDHSRINDAIRKAAGRTA
jgi:hypothetical protein